MGLWLKKVTTRQSLVIICIQYYTREISSWIFYQFLDSFQVIRVLISVLVVFIICWAPYLSMQIYRFSAHNASDTKKNKLINDITIWLNFLSLANSCLNPILYGAMSRYVYWFLKKIPEEVLFTYSREVVDSSDKFQRMARPYFWFKSKILLLIYDN